MDNRKTGIIHGQTNTAPDILPLFCSRFVQCFEEKW